MVDNRDRQLITVQMRFPDQDVHWVETADFIRKSLGTETPFIAPREFREVLQRVFPYDLVHAIEVLGQYGGVAVHKGLLHELPLPLLLILKEEWKCVFANDVFLFYMPKTSALPAASDQHQRPFHERLKSLQKLAEAETFQNRGMIAALVVASHAPAALDKTLGSLMPLHVPVFVMPISANAATIKDYGVVCRQHHAQLNSSDSATTIEEALKAGIRQWLRRRDITWICSFDDNMIIRPDFLLVAEKLRSEAAHQVLEGLWLETDDVKQSFTRDGVTCLIPNRNNSIHGYAHRKYWKRRFFPALKTEDGSYREWKNYFFPVPIQPLVLPGLITRQA